MRVGLSCTGVGLVEDRGVFGWLVVGRLAVGVAIGVIVGATVLVAGD